MWKILKKAQINWKIFCTHGLEDLILLKWSHYTKQPTDCYHPYPNFNENLHKYETRNSEICVEPQKKVTSQRNLETEWQKGRASWFQTILQSCINQTVWYCYKNGHKNHWNRIEMPEINPNICGQSIYDKKVDIIASGKDYLFKNGVVKAGWLHAKEWNWKTLTPFTKINSKWIKDLIISPEAIKILEEGLPLWLW